MINLKTLKKLVKNGLSAVGLVGLSNEIQLELVEQPKPVLAPLIQRLNLPELPDGLSMYESALFVFREIRSRFPKKVSRRVLGKISRHYGVDLRGYGLFRNIPGRSGMLRVGA